MPDIAPPGPPEVDPGELETALRSHPGVAAVRVIADRSGRLTEVHIVAAPLWDPKRLADEVVTVAKNLLRADIDRRIISIAQSVPPPETLPATLRPRLSEVRWSIRGSSTTCTVELLSSDSKSTGSAEGPSTFPGRLRMVGTAAISALATADPPSTGLDLRGVTMVELGPNDVAVVVISGFAAGKERLFVGAAFVRGDPAEAVARAVLDAANRTLPDS